MTNYYHVRISPGRKSVMSDFMKFQTEVTKTRTGIWDKDSQNKITVGDYLGFITGPVGDELIQIFKVERQGTKDERPAHWASSTPYTNNNGTEIVSTRQVIILTNKHPLPKTYEWREFRKITGLGGDCTAWIPRGTQRVVDKKKIPFDIESKVKSIRV